MAWPASMRQLAGASDVNVATLYHHFLEVGSARRRAGRTGLPRTDAHRRPTGRAAAGATPVAGLTRFVLWLWGASEGEEAVWRLLIGESLRGDATARAEAMALVDGIGAAVAGWLADVVPEVAGRADRVARLVRAAIFSLIVEHLALGPDEHRARDRVGDLVDAIAGLLTSAAAWRGCSSWRACGSTSGDGWCSTCRRSPSPTVGSRWWPGRRAPASRRCFGCATGWKCRPPARSASAAPTSPTSTPRPPAPRGDGVPAPGDLPGHRARQPSGGLRRLDANEPFFAEALEHAGLGVGFLDRRADDLSGGEAARLPGPHARDPPRGPPPRRADVVARPGATAELGAGAAWPPTACRRYG